MNLFYLADDFSESAMFHCDKHVLKMGIEACQLASNSHYKYASIGPYKKTHFNHPASIWCMTSLQNYLWTVNYGLSIVREYTYRYGKIHATQSKLEWLAKNVPSEIPDLGMTKFPLCMPDYCKIDNDPILSYRNYYNQEKRHLFKWKKRQVPLFIE